MTAPVAADGTFSAASSVEITLTVGGVPIPAVREVSVTGRFTGASVQGTLVFAVSFVYQGVALKCVGNHTWTATRTG